MLKLKLAKGKNADEEYDVANGNAPTGYVNHGTKLLKELGDIWAGKLERVVAEDSYFASVKSEKPLEDMGLGLIGFVNQASCHHPMAHIKRIYFICKGGCCGLVSVDEKLSEMMEFAWVDRDSCYLIVTEVSLEEG